MGGKDIHGTESFVVARNWLKETEDLFVIFEVEDRQKVQLAVWLLKGEASYWWEVTNAERPVETWEDFRALGKGLPEKEGQGEWWVLFLR